MRMLLCCLLLTVPVIGQAQASTTNARFMCDRRVRPWADSIRREVSRTGGARPAVLIRYAAYLDVLVKMCLDTSLTRDTVVVVDTNLFAATPRPAQRWLGALFAQRERP